MIEVARAARALLHRGDDGGEPIDRNEVGFNKPHYMIARRIIDSVDRSGGKITLAQEAMLRDVLKHYTRQLGEMGLTVGAGGGSGNIMRREVPDWQPDDSSISEDAVATRIPPMPSILGPDGVIASRLPGYEHRPQQIEAAEAVRRAILEGRHAVIEAGTGVGKSIAYLLPAIYSGRRTVVATSGKALQDQLISKDLPFLRDTLPIPFAFCALKGRSNYVCRRKLEDEIGVQAMLGESYEMASLRTWLAVSDTGDLEAMPSPLSVELAARITCATDECLGQDCPSFRECYYQAAHQRAESCQIIVVNHTLLALDCAIRDGSEDHAKILPDRELVIADESHALEEVATRAFEVEVSSNGIDRLLHAKTLQETNVNQQIIATCLGASEATFDFLAGIVRGDADSDIGSATYAIPQPAPTRLIHLAEAVALKLGDIARAVGQGNTQAVNSPAWKLVTNYQKRLLGLQETIAGILVPSPAHVLYCERRVSRKGRPIVALKRCPISVAEDMARALFARWTTICTSATLATQGNAGRAFAYFKARVGLDLEGASPNGASVLELQVGSPFDYRAHALIYLPRDGALFDPTRYYQQGSIEYLDRLAQQIEALLLASDGRAFCLFTSNRALDEVYRRIAHRLRWLVLRQGDAPRSELLRRFREDGHAVLFAVRSFWEGIDLAGDALSLVTIDKLPFNPPDDPVYAARCEALNTQYRDKWAWFSRLALPMATIAIKQGFGRLIRTKSDIGVVALLDGRLSTKGYGTGILRALPPATPVRSIAEVETFFKTREVPYRQDVMM